MNSWRVAATNTYRRCIGLIPSVTLTTGVIVFHEVEPLNSWMKKLHSSLVSFSAPPFIHKREIRHVIVPCGDINFDVYVLGRCTMCHVMLMMYTPPIL